MHFCITLSSKTIPSIFKMNNFPHPWNAAIFGMGITKDLVAVHSYKHSYPFSIIILTLQQMFIRKVLSHNYLHFMNKAFDWVRVSVLSWKFWLAKQFLLSLAHEGVNASNFGSKDFEAMDKSSSVSFPGPIIKTGIDEDFWYSDYRACRAREHHSLQVTRQKAKQPGLHTSFLLGEIRTSGIFFQWSFIKSPSH